MKALFWEIRRASLCTLIPGGARSRNFTSAFHTDSEYIS